MATSGGKKKKRRFKVFVAAIKILEIQASSFSQKKGKRLVVFERVDGKEVFQNYFDLLYDPNVWIFDTGATRHTTGYKLGILDLTVDTCGTFGWKKGQGTNSDGGTVGRFQYRSMISMAIRDCFLL